MFRKTHDLADLGSQCVSPDPTHEAVLREFEELTDYASAFRYPDAPYEPDRGEAAAALAAVRPTEYANFSGRGSFAATCSCWGPERA